LKAYCVKVRNEQEEEYYQLGRKEARKEECEFLGKILSMPFFEFCLLVKERKEALVKEVSRIKL